MEGDKLPSAQRSLLAYLAQTGPRDVLGLIDFDSVVRQPVVLRGGPADKAKAMAFVSGLSAFGGTSLYDAVEAGRDWLRRTRRPGEILAVVVLTDGKDSGSTMSLGALEADLRNSGFASDDRIGVFTIGYGNWGDYVASALRRIAESNGGVFVEGTPDSILKRMEQLQLSF
jgi:Ca-activated chloride channel family protein